MKTLEHLSVLKISGDDATEFLQGQMTQDTGELNDDQIHLTSFCNPQGRIIATSLIQYRNEAYYLILSSDLIDDLKSHLQRYILRSKVTVEQSESMVFGIYTNNSVSNQQLFKSLSNDSERMLALANQVPENIDDFIPSEEWIQCDIKKKIPIITKESSEKFIPQMLNLDILDAVSFSKGCYTGQEVIARVQHRGKIKQRMFVINNENQSHIPIGSEIQHESKKVGTVVISALINEKSTSLAVINTSDSGNQLNIRNKEIVLL